MKKILLTTVQKPFGIKNEHVMAELFHAQVTKIQGIFSFRSVYYGWGIEFIANNLKSPTTVLHYPSKSEFIKELKKGYDYVGINFVLPTWYKAKELIEIIREKSPKTKIILGGYGTVLGEVDEYADYVCRGEGLEFMQDLLGEEPIAEYRTPVMVNKLKCMSLPIGETGVLFAGLGCPNGCDFCCTSHFFKKKHIPLLKTGKEIYEAMKKYDNVLPENSYSIIDEDFLKDKKRVEELYQYTSKDLDKPRSFVCFASAKSIMQYEPEWLVELGINTIWIGVESKFYKHQKRIDCDMKELFDSLHKVGINTLGSMIVGVDEHTPENIWEDIDNFISLNSSLSQFLIYSPCPTTPLWDRLEKEERLMADYPLEDRDGFHLLFKHDNFSAEEIEKIQIEAFRKDFYKLGPSIIRYVEKALAGYRYFKESKKGIHIARRKEYRNVLARAYPLFGAVIRNAPSKEVKNRTKELKKEIAGILTAKEKIIGKVLSIAMPFFSTLTKFSLKYTTSHLQPKTMVNRYNFNRKKSLERQPKLKIDNNRELVSAGLESESYQSLSK